DAIASELQQTPFSCGAKATRRRVPGSEERCWTVARTSPQRRSVVLVSQADSSAGTHGITGNQARERTRMTFVRTIRGLRACLLACFTFAQVAGVLPLIYDHTLNVFETTPVVTHAHVHIQSATATPDGDHHHGVLDLHDQCCALHTLTGPLPQTVRAVPADFVGARVAPAAVIALAQGTPSLPDRPPRSLPLI